METKLGRMVEIEPGELMQLAENAMEMKIVSRLQGSSWFYRYVKAHKASHAVIRTIIERSHAS